MARNLKTVSQFTSGTPWTESQLRWYIFNSHHNGMTAAGAIVRIGRRVFIDADGFERWIEAQNPSLSSPTPSVQAGVA